MAEIAGTRDTRPSAPLFAQSFPARQTALDLLLCDSMNLRRVFFCGVAGLTLAGGWLWAAESNPPNVVATTPAVYVPDTSHQNDALPDGVLAWDSLSKEATVAAEAGKAMFVFNFTNIATVREIVLVTNVTTVTNVAAVTNAPWFWLKKISRVTNFSTATIVVTNNITRPDPVAVMNVYAGCACTTAQLPPMPWILPPGTNAQIGFTVNLAGRTGTMFKMAKVTTDRGFKQLMFKITILPPVMPTQSEADRARAMETAKADRQAIFRGDCVTCHVKPGENKYGKPLYDAVCGICHESPKRASMVPDLHNIKAETNADFWRTWTAHGKAGSLMPAFANTDGGSLSDMQVASIVQYLSAAFPSQKPENQ
jgi:mono/diheme cytochrome c family protein